MTDDTIHTCSYSCERPGCIRAQRDYLAARLAAETSNARGEPVPVLIVDHVGGTHEDVIRALPSGTRLYAAPLSAPVGVDDALIAGAMEAAADATRHRPGAREGGGVMDRTMQMVYETEREQYEQAMRIVPEAVVEAVARAICVACEENPDRQGDARGNEFRWQDYRDAALAAINALAAEQQGGAE